MSKTDTEMTEELEILNKERDALKLEKERLTMTYNSLIYQRATVDRRLNECEKKITQIKTSLDSKNMFNEEIIAKFADFHLISVDEQTIISNNIDKTDYTRFGRARYIDLEDVIDTILTIKRTNPTWELRDIQNTGHLDKMPPYNIYEFTFITQEGFCFRYGGMQALC